METFPQAYSAPEASESQQSQHVTGSAHVGSVPPSLLWQFVSVSDLPLVLSL